MTTTRNELLPPREHRQEVMTELGKYDNRHRQLHRAFWGVYGLTDRLVFEHTPCEATDCVTCKYLKDALVIFYAIDALTARDFYDCRGGTP